jgi:hypothetical protein
MSGSRRWCAHPLRHKDASKTGRSPSHPQGKYLIQAPLAGFLNRAYVDTTTELKRTTFGEKYLCTRCFEYEMARFQNTAISSDAEEVADSEDSTCQRLRPLFRKKKLRLRDDHKGPSSHGYPGSRKSDTSSEDESSVTHEVSASREILNSVFKVMNIEKIADV